MAPHTLIRTARQQAGLTQAELGARAGMTQSAVARLERPGSNPRFETLAGLLRSAGMRLIAEPVPPSPDVDRGLVATLAAATPAERIRRFEGAYDLARRFSTAGAAR